MKFRPNLGALGLTVLAAAVSPHAGAEGDAAHGKILAYTCQGCHGVETYKNAYPNYSVPKLGGQSAAYLENALAAYATGDRPHQTMHSHAISMTEQDRADIAAFLQGEMVQSGKEPVGTPPPATQVCVACHGADGATAVLPDYPILAGQHPDYLVQALHDYKSGRRKNPIMAGIVAGVEEKDFETIARFFAQQPGLCNTQVIARQGGCR